MSCPACMGSAAVIRDCVGCLRADLARANHDLEGTVTSLEAARADLARVTAERDEERFAKDQLWSVYCETCRKLEAEQLERSAARAETARLRERVKRAYEQLERSGDYIAFRGRIKAVLTSDPEPTT